jgi:hypothetical protein
METIPARGPVLEEGADPFLLLAREVGFGVEGSLGGNTSTEWALFMALLRSHYEQYLPIEGTKDNNDEVTFGRELVSGINGVTGFFRRKNGIVSAFFKIAVMGREMVPFSLICYNRKPYTQASYRR